MDEPVRGPGPQPGEGFAVARPMPEGALSGQFAELGGRIDALTLEVRHMAAQLAEARQLVGQVDTLRGAVDAHRSENRSGKRLIGHALFWTFVLSGAAAVYGALNFHG